MRFRTWCTGPPLQVQIGNSVECYHLALAKDTSALVKRLSSSAMGGRGARSSVLCGRVSIYLLVSVGCMCAHVGVASGKREEGVANVCRYCSWGVVYMSASAFLSLHVV